MVETERAMFNFLMSVLASLIASILVLTLDRARLPKLLIRADNNANVIPKHIAEKWKFLRLTVQNKKMPFFLGWLVRQTAENCRATLTFLNKADEQLFVMRGRWADTPELVYLSPHDQAIKVSYPEPITIPSGKEEILDCVVMKSGDKEAYGWNNEAYFNNWKTPHYKLSKGCYKVKVEVNTQNGVSFSRTISLQIGENIETTFF